jgi:O-antigen/teichoic acid export membrane protein
MKTLRINQIARLLSIACNSILIAIVAIAFDKQELGFYYLIYSLLFLQIFFELGISKVSSQLIARKHSKGQSDQAQALANYFERLFNYISVFGPLLIFGIGLLIAPPNALQAENFILAWLIASVGLSFSMRLTNRHAIIEGFGGIRFTSISRMIIAPTVFTISATLLHFEYGLLAVPLANTTVSLVASIVAAIRLSQIKHQTLHHSTTNFKSDIWPLLRPTAITWIAGYLTFYLYVPILARFSSPETAGQFGLTFQILFSLSSFSLITFQTNMYGYTELLTQGYRSRLNKIFLKDGAISILLFFVFSELILLFVYPWTISHYGGALGVTGIGLQMMVVGTMLQTGYLIVGYRSRVSGHDRYYWVNVVNAVLTIILLLLFSKYGVTAAAAIYLTCAVSCYLLLLVPAVLLRVRCTTK